MLGGTQPIAGPRNQPNESLRTQVAVDRLVSQQHFAETGGIQVRLSNQNKVFLNTRRPTRIAIPASLLMRTVPGFRVGLQSVLKVAYLEKDAVVYHSYFGGNVFVPTAPKEIGSPGDILTIRIEQLQLPGFLDRFSSIEMANEGRLAWFADVSKLRISREGSRIRLSLEQDPPPENGSPLVLEGRLLGELECKAGIVFTDIELPDVFGVKNEFRFCMTEDGRFGLGTKQGRSFLPVVLLSSDGVRLRIAYNNSKGTSTTVQYLERPSQLYSVGKLRQGPSSLRPEGSSRFYRISDVTPLRELELFLIKYGNKYEIGRIGAEIAHAIIDKRFGCSDLILAEPAKGGKDLYSKDGRVAVQSRMLVHLPKSSWETEIQRQFEQMVKKLGVDFGYTRSAEVGYAVLSFSAANGITSLIAEVLPR